MENAVESMIIAFAVIVFVIALSLTIFMLSKAMTTTENLIYYSDKTNYLDNITVKSTRYTRYVSIDTVVASLYRYYKESFMVKIYDIPGNLVQVFDTTIESKIRSSSTKVSSKYTDYSERTYMFKAPWSGDTDNTKYRIDLYVSGKKGYVKEELVNYNGNGLYDIGTTTFEETFIEYMYDGETISTEDGIETITGSRQEKNKIIIEYRAK